MDTTIEQQIHSGGAAPIPPQPSATTQATLEKLTRWQVVIDARMHTQMNLLEVLEECLLIELRTHYSQGNIDPHFIETLIDTVLQRLIDQQTISSDETQDAPYRWEQATDVGFAPERRDVMVQTVESAASGFIEHYGDYLRRHWRLLDGDAALVQTMEGKRDEHLLTVAALFKPDQLTGLDVEALRGKIEQLQDAWQQVGQMTALATSQERQQLDGLATSQLPHWLNVLKAPDLATMKAFQAQTAQARALVDALLDGLDSPQAYARKLIKDHVRLELGMEVEPDSMEVQLRWLIVAGQPVHTRNLSELLAQGPLRKDSVSVLSITHANKLRNQPLALEFVSQMLADVDAPASYWQALSQQYARAELKDAMRNWYSARLQQSAFVARCAGHLSTTRHDSLKALWENDVAQPSAAGLQVRPLTLPNALKCADLLVFYRDGTAGAVDDLVLYAPGKPDGQEWVELPSLRAVSAEMSEWTKTQVGREYLLQQISPSSHGIVQAFFGEVENKPSEWKVDNDLRGAETGFDACLAAAVTRGLNNYLGQVRLNESPRWYAALAEDSRRAISSLRHESGVHEQIFNEKMVGYEVFVDFAKRLVKRDSASYMRSKGVTEDVDPATVLIDYPSGLADGPTKQISFLDMAIYGYDDNWAIDDARRGVRSSVGQDLSKVRSADLALYARRAYVGEKYALHIRTGFLNVQGPAYALRRDAYSRMQLGKLDRDLRIAHGKAELNAGEYRALTQLVTQLGTAAAPRSPLNPEDVVTTEGLLRFTLGNHEVLGVYVFAYISPSGPETWLYTPAAPDGVLFRSYKSFTGPVVAYLRDYILERVPLVARAQVGRLLTDLAKPGGQVDSLRERNRVPDIKSEFDAYISRAVTDVEDITTSRAEMIQGQVFKGLTYAAAPICMISLPFAVLLDAVFIAYSVKQAIDAHIEGDTAGALEHWMEVSWGALFAFLGAKAALKPLWGAVRSLKFAVRLRSLSARRLRRLTTVAVKEVGPVVRPIHFNSRQAVSATPKNLVQVTEEGIFQGTYRSPSSATQTTDRYYLRNKGKYFQVKKDPYFDGLCLVDARRPNAIYQQPVIRMANGKWTHNKVGLRGGSDEVRNLGRLSDLRKAFPDHANPQMARGALQGEAVVATFSATAADNYLFSMNAQSCVIASLYNPASKAGAVLHFDHNIRPLIERSVKDVLTRLGGDPKNIRATLVGGDWLSAGADIGGPVRAVMMRQGVRPSWDYWSYSSCLGNSYGVSLDLRTGITSVFKTSQRLVEGYYNGAMKVALKPGSVDPVSTRLNRFMDRFRREPLAANADGVVHRPNGAVAPKQTVELHAIAVEALN